MRAGVSSRSIPLLGPQWMFALPKIGFLMAPYVAPRDRMTVKVIHDGPKIHKMKTKMRGAGDRNSEH